MSTKLPLNDELLTVILTVQAAQTLFMREATLTNQHGGAIQNQAYMKRMKSPDDWLTCTRNYFFSMGREYIHSLGLAQNEFCFESIRRYEVTEAMMETPFEELDQFSFAY